MLNNKSFGIGFILFLVLGSTVAQVATQITTPLLPIIAKDFAVGAGLVQRSISAYLLGMALSGIILGYLSDYFGRRRVMLAALLLGVLGTGCCIFAQNVIFLIIGRFIQGVGLSGVWIISRAITRDISVGSQLAKIFSLLTMLDVLIICLSPLLGGIIESHFGWRFVFVIFLSYNLVVMLAAFCIKSKLKQPNVPFPGLYGLFKPMLQLLKNKTFLFFNGIVSAVYAIQVTYSAVGTFIFQNDLGLSATEFGLVALLISIAYIFGAFINSRIVSYLSIKTIFILAIIMMWIGLAILLSVCFFIKLSLAVMLVFVVLGSVAGSIVMINGLTMALSSVDKDIGSSSAVMSTCQFIAGFIFTGLISFFDAKSIIPFTCILAFLAIIITILSLTADFPEKSYVR